MLILHIDNAVANTQCHVLLGYGPSQLSMADEFGACTMAVVNEQ